MWRRRTPLHVQVMTEPPLRGCWSVNLSATGIGLIAAPRGPEEGPREGTQLRLSFNLPGAALRLRAEGEVRWRHDVPAGPESAAAASLGVHFSRFSDDDQVLLVRYLSGHRLQVAIAAEGAAPEQTQAAAAALEPHAALHLCADEAALEAVLERGDIACVVVLGQEERRAAAQVEALAARRAPEDSLRDLVPRVVYCAPASAERLVALFNADKVFRALAPRPGGPEGEALAQAVLAACREHGVRTEQHRMGMELERHLHRQQVRALAAQAAPAPGAERPEPGFASPAMRRVRELLALAAPHRVAVLLQGETGTGKEVLARSLHALGGDASGPFVVQDCGALTETLLESELFGHVKGAFTGAVADHPGLFVLAHGGTLFLDEIENTTPNLQAKLLRVLETGDVRPVGGARARRVDVRVVAASNRDLAEEVKAGRFRADLFYRLNSFTLDLPPLRERPEDVLPLAEHFLALFNARLGRSARGLAPEAAAALQAHGWPGNVRELKNALERAVLLSQPALPLGLAQLPEAIARAAAQGSAAPARPGTAPGSLRARLDALERALIREALERHGGVLRRAAAELQTDAVTLGRRARRHGLWGDAAAPAPRGGGSQE
ncbi:MAG TPA: sigma 54-interacting transcriptional regulator [Aggregicoccus sp.]|nr:sigma 54-interacting transcriptional regulator [Aggregicoccus sp.]